MEKNTHLGSLTNPSYPIERVLHGLSQPALLLTLQGEIIASSPNAAELFNLLDASPLSGLSFFTLCHHNKIPLPFSSIESALSAKASQTSFSNKIIQWSASLISSEENVPAVFIIGFDVTSFINTVKQERNINNSIIDHIPNHYIFWKDLNSVYLGCNAALASSVGLTNSADIIGKTDYDLPTTKEQSDAYRADDQFVMSTKQSKLNIEEQQTLNDGETRVLSTSKTPLFNEKGDMYGVLAIYSNITERKQMELSLQQAKDQAEAANRAKTEFIVNMSHDIRTPLSGIIGISKLLEETAPNPSSKQYARWLNESSEQLLELLNAILQVVSTENISKNELNYKSFHLAQCLENIAQLEMPTIKMRELDFFIEIDPSIPTYIFSDETKLHRILLNLLGNAIKFTQKGFIKILVSNMHAEQDHTWIKFSLIDTGIGIASEQQDKVFDRFYRASLSSKGIYRGFGVGLHITQEYVHLLGGETTLESVLGEGTTVSFTLPIKHNNQQDNQTQLSPLISENNTAPYKTGHVLLVEDNIIALHLIEALTAQAGLTYVSATNGETAFNYAKSTNFDMIITDIGLPNISGYELTAAIRQWEQATNRPPVPIIGLTAHASHSLQKECLQAGMQQMISKPIDVATIKKLMHQYKP